jgi:hypothetical protein
MDFYVLPAHFAAFWCNRKSQKKVRDAVRPRTEPVPVREGGDRAILVHQPPFVSMRKLFPSKNTIPYNALLFHLQQ